ncbi:MAG TPA: class I SAM-dependent methyltransferase [Acidimicrobiales bacterium]|nr:class I SAM-dependent methyltransferase [Acidimicrobiales bacterium]
MKYKGNPSAGGAHSVVADLVPSGSRVLDVGCASGYLGEALRAKGCRVWGVDGDARSLAAVPANVYEDVTRLDLDHDQPPWPHLSFDVVVAADVLEHLVSPVPALEALIRRLDHGGKVIVSVPNVANVVVRGRLLLGQFEYQDVGILDRTHLHLYTFATAQRLLEDCGLQVEGLFSGSDRFGGLLNGSPVIGRLLRGLLAYNVVAVGRLPPTG